VGRAKKGRFRVRRDALVYAGMMVTYLSREQSRLVDRIAIDEYGISGIVLMENAGRGACDCIVGVAEGGGRGGDRSPVVIFCGGGNNGGDGYVIARYLRNAGFDVRIGVASDPTSLPPDAATNYRICRAMNVSMAAADSVAIDAADVVVDALLGTGFRGVVRATLAELIERINHADKRAVVAIDIPSGLDCDTGQPSNATIRADQTVTFFTSKRGFEFDVSDEYTGGREHIRVVDIGAPHDIVERILLASREP
jgi:NAD(P)H-hydrate epimerase